MSITSGIVLYAVPWFLSLFVVLPLGVRSQDEAGDVAPGTPAGAPENLMMGRKMLWATIAAAVAWAIAFAVIEGGIIDNEDIRSLAPFDRP